jgi:hypothetical protein
MTGNSCARNIQRRFLKEKVASVASWAVVVYWRRGTNCESLSGAANRFSRINDGDEIDRHEFPEAQRARAGVPVRRKIIVVVAVFAALAVGADYQGYFGYREEGIGDYIHVVFEFVDAETRAPVSDVHVACTRPAIRSACTETRGPNMGQTTITLAAYRRVKRSLLFSEDLGYRLGSGGVLYLTFIPENHERRTLEVTGNDPILSAGRPYRIELIPSEE